MNGRKRTVQIKFRVTEEERAFIEQKMQLVPTRNMEAYWRKMAIDGYIIQIDHADIKAIYRAFLVNLHIFLTMQGTCNPAVSNIPTEKQFI